jgi:hypothetical protein
MPLSRQPAIAGRRRVRPLSDFVGLSIHFITNSDLIRFSHDLVDDFELILHKHRDLRGTMLEGLRA